MLEGSPNEQAGPLPDSLWPQVPYLFRITFFKIDAHQTHSQGAHTALWKAEKDRQSSQAQALTGGDGYATGLHNFPLHLLDITASGCALWMTWREALSLRKPSRRPVPLVKPALHSVGSCEVGAGYAQAARFTRQHPTCQSIT